MIFLRMIKNIMSENVTERDKLRQTIQAMKKSRRRGISRDNKGHIQSDESQNYNVVKPDQKERSFRQQEEFGAKKRIKP